MGIILNESVEELIESKESLEKNKKQQEYLDYIKDHVSKVKEAFKKYFVPLLEMEHISDNISDENFKDAIRKAFENVLEHDASKYGDEEFDGYREKYYPTAKEKADPEFQIKSEERSEIAWVHHYENNPHHPAYWLNKETNTPEDMSLDAIIEMICDWKSFGDDTQDWYRDKAYKEKSVMTNKTKEIVEEILFNIIK